MPRYLKADVERGLLYAYYRYVCGCKQVYLGDETASNPWVVWAARRDRIWLMHFSSHYEFPEAMKPATVVRRLTEDAESAAREGYMLRDFETGVQPLVSYEVWCFFPPSARLLAALEAARNAGASVDLILPGAVAERIRQTVLAVPESAEEPAFVWAARLIRRAFGLDGGPCSPLYEGPGGESG